jgi:cyclopropane fatty-acyl-phospholipid synthase-like methyltransferase
MTTTHEKDTVYASPKFRDVDVGAIMRDGHPDIADGDEFIVSSAMALRMRLKRALRIIDVGSGSGDLSLLLAEKLPDSEVIANDIEPNPVAQARAKLAPFEHASVFDQPFEEWPGDADIVISWGSHHHLSHDYLAHAREVLTPEGALVIGDEFCPEYLTALDQQRLARAEKISIVDGYVFDNDADIAAYASDGIVPKWSSQLEEARRKALWTWYKFVGDYAVGKGHWPVLIAELGIARDDLITEFDDEHKTSPCLLERELQLNGFRVAQKKVIGDRAAELRSFVIYVCSPARKDGA